MSTQQIIDGVRLTIRDDALTGAAHSRLALCSESHPMAEPLLTSKGPRLPPDQEGAIEFVGDPAINDPGCSPARRPDTIANRPPGTPSSQKCASARHRPPLPSSPLCSQKREAVLCCRRRDEHLRCDVDADSEGVEELGCGPGGERLEVPCVDLDLVVEVEPAAGERDERVSHRDVGVGDVAGGAEGGRMWSRACGRSAVRSRPASSYDLYMATRQRSAGFLIVTIPVAAVAIIVGLILISDHASKVKTYEDFDKTTSEAADILAWSMGDGPDPRPEEPSDTPKNAGMLSIVGGLIVLGIGTAL